VNLCEFLLNSVKQKFQYFVKLWLFANRMNSSNQTVVAVPLLTVNKYYSDDRLIDCYASYDISCC